MTDIDYSKQIRSFIAEIIAMDVDEFKDPEKWTRSKEILNGVKIGYELPIKSSRMLLHEIGQKHGVIPLCPDDVVDLKLSKEFEPVGVIVISRHGEFSVRK
jgi:orotidine-5'-phosphate decarboxylase